MNRRLELLGRHLKTAFRSICNGWRQYIFFLAAMAVVQCLLFLAVFSGYSSRENEKALIADDYNYHVLIQGLTRDEQFFLNIESSALKIDLENQKNLVDYWMTEADDGTYRMYLVLTGDLDSAYSYIYGKYLAPYEDHITATVTPLYLEGEYLATCTWESVCLTLAVSLFSCLLLAELYRIRVNHDQFRYAIFMTCGADFRRLFFAAAGEMLMVSALTLIPAGALSLFALQAIYRARGWGVHFHIGLAFLVFALNLGIALFAVWAPMKRLSRKPPVGLLGAADNANLVVSPRRSFRIFGKKFPLHYELYGIFRFRRYYLRLLCTATAFAAIFVVGLTFSDMQELVNARESAEYMVTYTADLGDSAEINAEMEDFLADLEAIPGISHGEWEVSPGAASLSSAHLLIPQSAATVRSSAFTVSSAEQDGYTQALNNYRLVYVDDFWVSHNETYGQYTLQGDPRSVLEDENKVIVSQSVNEANVFSFQVGDPIVIAVWMGASGEGGEALANPYLTEGERLLLQIRYGRFVYRTYTVGAVITGGNTEGTMMVGVNADTYTTLSGQMPLRDQVALYVEEGSDLAVVSDAEETLRHDLRIYAGWQVTRTNAYYAKLVYQQKNTTAFVLIFIALILLLSPLFWFYSQTLFEEKRQKEFFILRAYGATDSSLFRLHLVTGGVMAAAALFFTVALSALGNALLYWLGNNILPSFGMDFGVRFPFGLSVQALLLCMGISLACGFLSCLVPYLSGRRRQAVPVPKTEDE